MYVPGYAGSCQFPFEMLAKRKRFSPVTWTLPNCTGWPFESTRWPARVPVGSSCSSTTVVPPDATSNVAAVAAERCWWAHWMSPPGPISNDILYAPGKTVTE